MLKFKATSSARQASECVNAVISGLSIKDEGIWSDLRKILEKLTQACGGSDYSAINQNLPINAHQCQHMHLAIRKLFQDQREHQNPLNERFLATAVKVSRIATRALKLVEECSTGRWLLKAVEIGAYPEHFVELHLDLHWSSNVLSWAGQDIGCDEFLDNLRGLWSLDQRRMVLEVGDKDNRCFITEVHECREKDGQNLMGIVNRVIIGRQWSDVDRQLASILIARHGASIRRARHGCHVNMSFTPPDLERHVKSFKFNISVNFLRLGQGGSSFVVKYRWVYETKFVLKIALKPSKEVDIITKREADILEKCRHPYIVGIVGCWKINSRSLIMMEFMKCTLTKLMKEKKEMMKRNPTCRGREGFSASEAIDLLLPVAKALRYMHGKAKPIAHRDIKPDNIMLVREPEVATKLIDFGDSVEFDPSDFTHRHGIVGTTGYMAPELRHCNIIEKCDLLKADVFSFGMVLGELLTWKTPEEALRGQAERDLGRSRFNELLEHGWRPHLPQDVPVYVAFIVESCWRKSPSTRPGFGDICLMLQNAQHLLSLNVNIAIEEALSMVSYTDSDGTDWPIAGKFTLREMMNLEEEPGSDDLLREFLATGTT